MTAITVIACAASAGGSVPARKTAVPKLRHVFVVVLENTPYEQVAGANAASTLPYLTSLARKGVSLDAMYGVDHFSLTNYLALVSGHEANPKTKADCPKYDCIYEKGDDESLPDQLEKKRLRWKGYFDSMSTPCQHPAEGADDTFQVGYATRHNPFVYYRSIVGAAARCQAHVRPYADLARDLRSKKTTPNFLFVVPDTCHDAHDGGEMCSLPQADTWLSQNLPRVLKSKAFKDDGVLIVTFDESSVTDVTGCCGNSQGGHIATFVVSPLVPKPGAHSATPYNHYSLLRTFEDGFGLACLRHACDSGIRPLGSEVLVTRKPGKTGR